MRGHIQKRGKTSYRISISLGKGPDGKYRYYRETVRGNKENAERRLAELLLKYSTEDLAHVGDLTVDQLLDRWLEDLVKTNMEPNTYDFYSTTADYIRPELGHCEARKLHSLTIQTFYSKLQRKGGKDKSGLSPTTVRHVHSTLSACLNYGKQHGIILSNPCEKATPPEPADYVPVVWTAEEMVRVLDVCDTEQYGIYVMLVLYTGLRINEALALRWKNVDLKRRVIHVVEAIKGFPVGKQPIIGRPKTKAGIRQVPFSPVLAEALGPSKPRELPWS